MKCITFDDNCRFQIVKGYKNYEFVSSSMFHRSGTRTKQTVNTIIYSDGTMIEKIDDSLKDRDSEIRPCKYQDSFSLVDSLEIENFRIKDANYVVQVLVAKEFFNFGNVCGLYDVIKEINFYLRENVDKEVLKEAIDVLGYVSKFQNKYGNFFTDEHEPILLKKRRIR